MTFETYDKDRERGAPIDLYEFIVPGSSTAYKYTNHVRPILGYQPVPVKRQTIKTTGKFEKTDMQIRMPVTTPLSELFLPYPPPYVVKCVVRQMHLSDPNQQPLAVWAGRVLSSGREKNEAVFTVNSTILSFKRVGLNRNWQHGCPLLLYGPLCRATKNDHKIDLNIIAIDNGKLVLPNNWYEPYAHEKFRGGTIEWTSSLGLETRMIIATTPTSITLGGHLRDITADTDLRLFLGCRHDMDDCRATFNNINNYGGQPWIPFKNPVKQHPFW